jgi:twinkle protein
MDNDAPGQEGAQTFCKKLGLNRCFVVKCLDAKDANEALLKGLDLNVYLEQARVMPHERLLTFSDLRSEVLHELLEPDLYKGAAIPSLPTFTNLIKGFRRGEMTVLTGPTGSGKVGNGAVALFSLFFVFVFMTALPPHPLLGHPMADDH